MKGVSQIYGDSWGIIIGGNRRFFITKYIPLLTYYE